MKQIRKGSFYSQDSDDERVIEKIKRELGQGDWKIDMKRSGAMVKWVAEKDIPIQGPL